MANNKIFGTDVIPGPMVPDADTTNLAGGKAYSRTPAHDLAQLCCTGRLQDTFYANAKDQFDTFMRLLNDKSVDDEMVAKIAVYAREKGWIRDLPIVASVVLSKRNPKLWAKIFNRIIDSPGMLRSFVQVVRSGKCGRKSLGYNNRKLIHAWFATKTGTQLFQMSTGNNPSLADVIKLSHLGLSDDAEKEATIRFLCGKEVDHNSLPQIVKDYRSYRADTSLPQPHVPIEMLEDILDDSGWVKFAKRASLRAVLKNLTKFQSHGVFKDKEAKERVCGLLKNKDLIVKEKILPYSILQSLFASRGVIDSAVLDSLHDCLEHTIDNVPVINGKVYLCVDVSGSMSFQFSPSQNIYSGKPQVARPRYVDIAAMFAAALLRKNKQAVILPFDTSVHNAKSICGRDSVVTIAGQIAKFGGGGTRCELPLIKLNEENASGDVVIYISDNESWGQVGFANKATASASQWRLFKNRNPNAKLITIDIASYVTSQFPPEKDILAVGGWSDEVYSVIGTYLDGQSKSPDYWMKEIEKIEI